MLSLPRESKALAEKGTQAAFAMYAVFAAQGRLRLSNGEQVWNTRIARRSVTKHHTKQWAEREGADYRGNQDQTHQTTPRKKENQDNSNKRRRSLRPIPRKKKTKEEEANGQCRKTTHGNQPDHLGGEGEKPHTGHKAFGTKGHGGKQRCGTRTFLESSRQPDWSTCNHSLGVDQGQRLPVSLIRYGH